MQTTTENITNKARDLVSQGADTVNKVMNEYSKEDLVKLGVAGLGAIIPFMRKRPVATLVGVGALGYLAYRLLGSSQSRRAFSKASNEVKGAVELH